MRLVMKAWRNIATATIASITANRPISTRPSTRTDKRDPRNDPATPSNPNVRPVRQSTVSRRM